jgi:Putative Ice-binding-like adhesive domain
MRLTGWRSQGSILVWTVMTIAILSLLAAEVIRLVSLKYQSALQTATWQEALLAAESGIDLGIVELRKSLYPAPNHAWDGWNNVPGNGVVSYGLTTIPNAGLAGTPMTIEVNVDAPASFVDPTNGWQYYRIRTVGTMPISGPPRVADNKQDNRLRKLSLRFERFTNGVLTAHAISSPQVSRRIEAIVRPVSSFNQAIMSVGTVDLNNQNIVVDSYDSTDPTKSTNGLYDEAKRQENGDIATDGNLIDAGNAHIYGDVATNSGTVVGAANITGEQRDDFYQEPIPVGAPTWTSYNSTVTSVTATTTLTANATSGSSASRYELSTINLSSSKTLTLAGNPDGSPTYIEIYVTGDISFGGTSQLIIQPGVTAKIYFQGNVDIAGNGILNTNNQPSDLQLFGIQPATTDEKHVNLGGNGQIIASVYAPNHDVTINGGGTTGHVFGSVVGSTVTMTGVTNLHYDEHLGSVGVINSYKIVSWFEDTR